MKNKRVILIDFWGTLVESEKRNNLLNLILNNFKSLNFNKNDFFNYWKEKWFKSNIKKEEFIQGLNKKFRIGREVTHYLNGILDYKNLTLINGRLNSLLKLVESGCKIHLVSDCGYDAKEFVENSVLDGVLSKRFYSFVYETTKDEDLYEFVAKEMGTRCLMIGDDYKRDYEIPRKYGFDSALVRKTDILEDFIWKI